MKRLILSAAVVMAFVSAANAGTPETAAPSTAKSGTTLNTYYITGVSASNYLLSTSPNPDCGDDDKSPCEIRTSRTLGSSVPKADVDGEVNIEIIQFQHQL